MLEHFLENTEPQILDADVRALPEHHEATDVRTQMLEHRC